MNTKTFIILALIAFSYSKINLFAQERTVGTVSLNIEGAFDGYTLLAPINSKSTYLLNNCGDVLHEWKSGFVPGNEVQLLPNGNLLRTCKLNDDRLMSGGAGGRIEILNWESNVVWSSNYISESYRHHHDVLQLPNGNLMFQAWVAKSREESLMAGRDMNLMPEDSVIWSERVVEIELIENDSFNVVWEWNLWDHLIQDLDSNYSNFGDVSKNPRLIDINYATTPDRNSWVHINGISYNEERDQILLSSRTFSEVWIIDHSTTTAEASTALGGNAGHGGNLLYRFGNPQAYKSGTESDRLLFGQHYPHWTKNNESIDEIILFNNGWNGPEQESKVQLFKLPLNGDDSYTSIDNQFTSAGILREISSNTTPFFEFSNFISGAELLENGSILVCSGPYGTIAEIDSLGNLAWAYINPTSNSGIEVEQGVAPTTISNPLFRAHKYSKNYSGILSLFDNVKTENVFPIELNPLFSLCFDQPLSIQHYTDKDFKIYPNPVSSILNIESLNFAKITRVLIVDVKGKVVINMEGPIANMDIGNLNTGLYRVNLFNENNVLVFSHSIIKK